MAGAREIEIRATRPDAQESTAQPDPRIHQVEVQQVILQLVRSDHYRCPRVGPSVDESKAHHVLAYLDQRIRPQYGPDMLPVLS